MRLNKATHILHRPFSHSEIERFIEKPIALSELRKLVLDHTHNNNNNNNISCPN